MVQRIRLFATARPLALTLPAALLALLAFSLWRLDALPAWWDEGWTLAVARTWLEQGFYGRLLDGQIVAPGLQAAFPVTAPVALSMQLFGVGLWQGRLFGVLCALAAIGLLYLLAAALYDRPMANATLFILLLTPMHPQLHPILMGRQVLAEMPMLAYLLVGYCGLLLALRGAAGWVLLAALGWGLGLAAKSQPLPFWAVSVLAPLAYAALARQRRSAALLAAGAAGALAIAFLAPLAQAALLAGNTAPPQPLSGLYAVTSFALTGPARVRALIMTLILGLPTIAGLCYAGLRWLSSARGTGAPDAAALVQLALLSMAASWLAWFVLLSMGIERYLFPAVFIAAPFIALMLRVLTSDFNLPATLGGVSALLRGRLDRRGAGALVALLMLAFSVPLTVQTVVGEYLTAGDYSTQAVAAYLNAQTPPDARIETYESELHFFLRRPYHYPPDQLHVEMNQRLFLGRDVPIDYDPLAADPDYLVVGRFGRMWQLYDRALADGAFRLIQTFGHYRVYERVR